MRALHTGCELHGNSNVIGIVDGEGKRVFRRKLANDLSSVLDTLRPFQMEASGIQSLRPFPFAEQTPPHH